MKRPTLSVGAFATVIALFPIMIVLARSHTPFEQDVARAETPSPSTPAAEPATQADQGFLYGRVTGTDGATYEGRLRFGGEEEAFWSNYFNGSKDENPWAGHLPPALVQKRSPISIFGFDIPLGQNRIDLDRPFMARFGDIARIAARGRDLKVTLKSGTAFHLDRFGADDFADGVRVWDATRGVVDLDEWRVRSIDLLPTARLASAPVRLHGTVRTADGVFTGFIQWNRKQCTGLDGLAGYGSDGSELKLRFDTIRSIARHTDTSAVVTTRDGRQIALSGTPDAGKGHLGVYVDDGRYGRVLVSWEAFESLELSASNSGPGYGDFPAGRPLAGSVTTRAGRVLTGRVVYDLDESETTETLDAPLRGVTYTIPFGLIASIVPGRGDERARVRLHDGEELRLERTGDLGDANGGLLVFASGSDDAEYVAWNEVERLDFDRGLLAR
jgi:hypothetical protein